MAINPNPISRRRMLGLGAGAAAFVALAACGQAAPTPAPAKPVEPAKPAEAAKPVEAAKPAPAASSPNKAKGANLRILLWQSYKYEGIATYAKEFEDLTGAKLTFDPVADAELPSKQIVTLSGKTGEYDLTTVDEPYMPAYSSFLTELDPYVLGDKFPKEDWVPVMWDAGVFNGKTYAVAFDPNVQIFIYRKDIFEQKGIKVPTKFSEAYEAAKKIQGDQMAGWVMMAIRNAQTGINAWTFLTTWGNEIFDDKFQPAFDNDKGYQALEFYKKAIDTVMPKGVLGMDYAAMNAEYRQGKAGFMQQWASIAPGIKTSKDSVVADKTGYAAALGEEKRHSMRGVWSWGLPADGKQRDAAWEFVKWFTTPESMMKYVKAGSGNSPRLAVLDSPEFQKSFDHAPALAETFKIAKKRPIFKEYNEILDALNIMGSKVCTGEASPKDAIKEASGKLSEVMKRGGYLK